MISLGKPKSFKFDNKSGSFKNLLKPGDYVTFEHTKNKILYEVLEVDYLTKHFLYYDDNFGGPLWERFEYIYQIYPGKRRKEG